MSDEFALVERDIDLLPAISGALNTLWRASDREVIAKRFGLEGGSPMTLEAIAKQRGVSAARIRQIECNAIRILRHPSRTKLLRIFVEGWRDVDALGLRRLKKL